MEFLELVKFTLNFFFIPDLMFHTSLVQWAHLKIWVQHYVLYLGDGLQRKSEL